MLATDTALPAPDATDENFVSTALSSMPHADLVTTATEPFPAGGALPHGERKETEEAEIVPNSGPLLRQPITQTHAKSSKTSRLYSAHARTPERELADARHKERDDLKTPARREWNSEFIEKPSDEFRRKLADRRTLLHGSPVGTPPPAPSTGGVSELRGSNKRLVNVSPRTDSGLRPSSSRNSIANIGSSPRSPGSAGRTPKAASARRQSLPPAASVGDKRRKSLDVQTLVKRVAELEKALAAERNAHEATREEKERADGLYKQERAMRVQMENANQDASVSR